MKNLITLKDDAIHGTQQIPLHIYHQIYKKGGLGVPYHWHREIELIYIEQGTLTVTINTSTRNVHEGDFLCINSEELHELHSIGNMSSVHHALVFSPDILSYEYVDECQMNYIYPLLNASLKLPNVINVNETYGANILREFATMMNTYDKKEVGWYLYLKSGLIKILAILAHNRLLNKSQSLDKVSQKIKTIKKIISFIHENAYRKIYIDELASMITVNPQYFCRFFKSITGRTPIEYINQYRINLAAKMLRSEDCSILDVCYSVGFENPSYFIKIFKRYTSLTPTAYVKTQNDIGYRKIPSKQRQNLTL